MNNKDKVIKKFMSLVKIDSLSLQEKEMGQYLKKELKRLGCINIDEDRTAQKIDGNCGNIIAEFSGEDQLPTLLLSAHMDRVEPGTGIKPVIKDNYIVSQGETVLGADDLAGVAGILETLRIIRDNNICHGNLKIIFTVAEEKGLLGASNLAEEYYQDLDFGIVFDAEGQVGNVVNKGPTKSRFNATINGKSSHAAIKPEKGINAIKIASLAISSMNLGKIDKETTANIGVIRGGVASNVVPDLVELEGEVRSHQQDKLKNQIQHMRDQLNKYVKKYQGNIDYDIKKLYNSFSLNEDSKYLKLLSIAAQKTELEIKYIQSCGGNDANIYNQKNMPAVSLAVGAENVHSRDEKIKIEELSKLVKFTVNIIKTAGENII